MLTKKFLIFILLFMVFHYILLITEWKPYLDMCSDIQGYKYNFFKSQDNKLRLIPLIIFTLGFFIMVPGFSYFLGEKLYKINLVSFLFIIFVYAAWDFSYYTMFDKAQKHLPVLLYDTILVGGLCLLLTQFIFNKYYKILEKNIPILVLLYFVTMFLFFYVCYKYNPDLSNISGIYNIHHFLTFIVIFIIIIYIFYKLK
jgi:hypothetical protein